MAPLPLCLAITMPALLHELVHRSAQAFPNKTALVDSAGTLDYAALSRDVSRAASAFIALRLGRSERVAIYLEKRRETVTAMFAAAVKERKRPRDQLGDDGNFGSCPEG